jgi:hypothetical protein
MKNVLLTLDSEEIEALSQFHFWLHRADDRDNPCTDALSKKDENGAQHLMTIEELAEDYGADKVFERINEAWATMHEISKP